VPSRTADTGWAAVGKRDDQYCLTVCGSSQERIAERGTHHVVNADEQVALPQEVGGASTLGQSLWSRDRCSRIFCTEPEQ